MSTYLQLCQKLARECQLPTTPSDTTTQTGELLNLVNWVDDAYTEIQNRHQNWRWLRSTFSVNTTASDDTYAYGDCTDSRLSATITRFSRWRFEDAEDAPRIYLTSSGVGAERFLIYIPYEYFQSIYRIGTQNDGQPAHISIDPQDNIVLGPSPDADYTVTGDYQMAPQELSADSDTPEMPSQYHNLIVYAAMIKYGYSEAAQEIIARGNMEYRRMLRQLETNQLPRMRLAYPLV